jgi:galactoside O-acetyltransferase
MAEMQDAEFSGGTSFYSRKELRNLGLKSFGENVFISRKISIYSPDSVSVGNNVRIDDFCILSGKIKIGSNVHISAFCALYGKGGIILEDFTGISVRCILFSACDDFSGEFLIGPLHGRNLTNVKEAKILMKKFSQLGANTIVMPGVEIGEGAVTGAMTFVNKNLSAWTINTGIPVCKSVNRSRGVLQKIERATSVLGGGRYVIRLYVVPFSVLSAGEQAHEKTFIAWRLKLFKKRN